MVQDSCERALYHAQHTRVHTRVPQLTSYLAIFGCVSTKGDLPVRPRRKLDPKPAGRVGSAPLRNRRVTGAGDQVTVVVLDGGKRLDAFLLALLEVFPFLPICGVAFLSLGEAQTSKFRH